MSDRVFIDTNIFVYCELEDKGHVHKREKAIELLDSLEPTDIIVSVQVLSELYSVLLKNKIDDMIIQKKLKHIADVTIICNIGLKTIKKCWKIRAAYKYSYYDSLIIAAAIESNCSILYSEDMQNYQKIEKNLIIKNPFA